VSPGTGSVSVIECRFRERTLPWCFGRVLRRGSAASALLRGTCVVCEELRSRTCSVLSRASVPFAVGLISTSTDGSHVRYNQPRLVSPHTQPITTTTSNTSVPSPASMVQLTLHASKGNNLKFFPHQGYLGLTPVRVEGGTSNTQESASAKRASKSSPNANIHANDCFFI
jgi:hypothetical protein